QVLQRARIECRQIGSLEAYRAAVDTQRRLRQQSHHRQRGHAFAAAGFADQTEYLARPQMQCHILQHRPALIVALPAVDADAEILYMQRHGLIRQRSSTMLIGSKDSPSTRAFCSVDFSSSSIQNRPPVLPKGSNTDCEVRVA